MILKYTLNEHTVAAKSTYIIITIIIILYYTSRRRHTHTHTRMPRRGRPLY